MTSFRFAQMLGVANIFLGIAGTSPLRPANLLIGVLVAAALYLDNQP